MTRFIYDQFAKDYLEVLLGTCGEVNSSKKVASEVTEIDVIFTPNPRLSENRRVLGLLGKMAVSPGIFEPFHHPINPGELWNCVIKLGAVSRQLQREANRTPTRISESELPKLWMLTPTASPALLSKFGGKIDDSWMAGVYFLPEGFRSAVVVIHQLPIIPETLWLRMFGLGRVQKQAISELEALPQDSPHRSATLQLLLNLRKHIEVRQEQKLNAEDKELIMRLAPLFDQELERNAREAKQQEKRLIIENLLRFRFGELDEALQRVVEQILVWQPEELNALILQLSQLSREELVARFPEQVAEVNYEEGERALEQKVREGEQRRQRLLTENFLKFHFGELDEELERVIEPISVLPPEEFTSLIWNLSELSREELVARFSEQF